MNSENQKSAKILDEIFKVLETEAEAEFSSMQVIHNAKTIKEEEINLLKEAAFSREEALSQLRKNNIAEGTIKLKKAKQILADINLSEEAFLIFSTYQSSAESFLCLKNKQFEHALDLMKNTLETHKNLFLKYNHAIEARRIHLGRNIVKILMALNKTVEAFALSTKLVQYTISDDSNWPLDYCKLDNPDNISLNIKMFVLNQLIIEIDRMLSKNISEEVIIHFKELITKLEQNTSEEAIIILSWCNAYYANINNDNIAFLKNALVFFQNHKGLIPHADHYMLRTLDDTFLS